MSSRDLKDLRADIRTKAEQHYALCESNGIDLLIYCTYRSSQEQDKLYAIGRTEQKNKPIITSARGGQSKHNNVKTDGTPASLAYDCVPTLHGKPQWDDKKLVAKVGELGESVGLHWAGRWSGRLKESVHFEV